MSQTQQPIQTAEEIKVAWANWCKNAKEQKAAKKQANSTFAQNIINQEITQKNSKLKHKDRWDDSYSDYSDNWGEDVDLQVNESTKTDCFDDRGNLVQTVIDCTNVTPAQAAINSEIIAKIRKQGGYEYEQHSDFAIFNIADIYDETTFSSNTITFKYGKEEHCVPEIKIIDATSGINRFFEWLLEKFFAKKR